VLPLIDLLILIAWTSLIFASLLKAVGVAMAYPYAILGMHPLDFVYVAAVSLLFALALAGRVWVRANEPALLRARREARYPHEPGALAPTAADGLGPEELRTGDGAAAGRTHERATAG